jgi:acetyltransferase-like isoleucine patch superfamily enzyme
MLTKLISVARYLYREVSTGFVSLLPNDIISTRIRRIVFKSVGISLSENVLIYRNVLLLGSISIGENSSVSNNTSINGATVGVHIGSNVMIAPGCCIVAFDHGTKLRSIPMIRQHLIQAPITIHDDVWIAANCTITKGTTIGTGAIIGANSVVTKDVAPFSIVAGVPAKFIKMRETEDINCV